MDKEGFLKNYWRRARPLFHDFFWAVVNAIFPAECVSCGAVGACVCAACAARLPTGPIFCCAVCMDPVRVFGFCERCFGVDSALVGVVAMGSNDAPELRRLVHALKYEGVREVGSVLGGRMASLILHLPPDFFSVGSVDARALVVPVPIHRRRLVERDFNQAELIAAALVAGTSGAFILSPDALERVRATEMQAHLTGESRRKNLSGAFAVYERGRSVLRDAQIILIDDVATTGATLRECARVLHAAGAARIIAIVAGRG